MIKADLHLHTAASADGRSSLDALIAAAKKQGLDAIAIADHDLCTPLPEEDGILLIPGVEITTAGGHILGLFLQQPIDMEVLCKAGRPSPEEACEAIRACGGFAVLAHPFAPQKAPEEELLRYPVDAVEGKNARAALKKAANGLAERLAGAMGKPMTGGSDGHHADEVGGCYTEFDCEERSLDGLRAAFAAGAVRPVLCRACRWRHKGLSQLTKARRSGKVAPKQYLYLGYTLLRGLFQK